jgi:thiol-disulfide isomerase/thioredoxin
MAAPNPIVSGVFLLSLLAACGTTATATPTPAPTAAPARVVDDSLAGVIDEPAAPWTVSQWFNSPPLTLAQLRGKVVLVRWFMGPSCPFCSATAPTLRTLHERYGVKGLAVIGMYHHKEETPLDPEQVAGWVKQYGYQFPVAIDKDWTTLDRWWLRSKERSFTSVSFLIDQAGVVRRVHLGGKLAPEGAEIDSLTTDIESLLAK